MTSLLYPIAVYLLLIGVTYFMIVQRILGIALQYPRYEIQSEQKVPADLKQLFQQPIAELEALGFQVCTYVQTEQVMSLADLKTWSVLLYNKASKTYADVEIRFPIESVNPFAVEFHTFFKDRTLLLTMNGKLHGLLGEIPNTILQDPYAADLVGQWQCHQSKLTQLNTKQPCGLAPAAFVTALETHLGRQIDQLVKTKQVLPLAGTPTTKQRFHYTWQAALPLAMRVRQGTGKAKAIVKQRSQQAKTNVAVRVNVPVALEVEGFRRQQQIEKGQVKRRWGIWLLLGSLILSIASFSTLFDARTIAILIGVLFLHELGHFLAMRLFGYRDTSMFFLPFFGAAVTGHKDDASLSEKFWVLMAGPLPGLLLGIGLAITQGSQNEPSWAQGGLWMLIGLNLFNLLPIYPLDGGKIANLLLFSRFSYTDVLFKLFAVLVLVLLGLGSPLLWGIALAVGFSIPAGFRSARVDAKLRQDYPKALNEQDELLHAIFATIKELGYGTLPFIQRYTLAKEVFQRHREAHAKWLTRISLAVLYSITLVGGMAGALQAIAPNWYRLIGVALEDRQTRIKRDIADATKTLAANPSDVDAYMKRGRMRFITKDYEGAIADANQLIRLQPKSPDGYRLRSTARKLTGDQQGADADLKQAKTLEQTRQIEHATQALRDNPNDAEAYFDRAVARYQQQDYKAAIADHSQSLRLDPNNPLAYTGRGSARQKLRDYKGAIADATQSIRLDPELADAYSLRAEAHRQLGDRKSAAADQQKADALSQLEK